MTGIAAIVEKIDDNLNPIIVKELRQIVRGRFFWGVLILFLGIQCAVLSISIADRGLTSRSVGAETLTFLFAFLFLACFALIPVHSGFRFAKERTEGSDELLFITTITPYAIIRGKFAASMIIILMIFSAFAPFMAMTFFLSGVDLSVTFFILAFALIISAGGTILQICFGSLARDASAYQFFRVSGLAFQIFAYFSINAITSDIIRHGIDRIFGSAYVFASVLTFAVIIGLIGYFLYVAAAAVIFPGGANRMYPVRLYLTALWLATLLISLFWAVKLSDFKIFYAWGYMVNFALSCLYAVAISERDFLTDRVAREIPESSLKKYPAFLLYSGAAGGIAWTLIMQAATFVMANFLGGASLTYLGTDSRSDYIVYTIGLAGFFAGYGLIAAFIRRIFLSSFVEIRNTWVVALCVGAIFAIAPLFLGSVFGVDADIMMAGSPMIFFQRSGREIGFVMGLIIAGIGLVINVPWLKMQISEFFSASFNLNSAAESGADKNVG